MKIKSLSIALFLGMFICTASYLQSQDVIAEPFLGMWALDLNYESHSAGWIEITQEEGYLDA